MGSIKKFCERMDYYCRVASVGYDQYQRWDVFDGGETDCSALVIHCLREAGYDTGAASYTGNMSPELTARGFKRLPANIGDARPGDILLNDVNHVAAVISGYGWGATIAQASIDENGNIAGGQAGDQTGLETNERGIYSYPWDCILRPPADEERKDWPVQLYTTNLSAAQKWFPSKQKDGSYVFTCKANGMVLDVDGGSTKSGAKVQAYKANGSKAQKWKLKRATKSSLNLKYDPPETAPWMLIPVCAPENRLDAIGAGRSDGTGVQSYKANGTNAQRWVILDNGDGSWTLINVGSGKALDLCGGGK